MATKYHQAACLGWVFSTTECGIAALSATGKEAYASVEMQGQATWHEWPTHYLQHVPEMIEAVLRKLQQQGWRFDQPGFLSQSWRQHDLALVGMDDDPLIPAPSWQCNGGQHEARVLNRDVSNYAKTVGRIEPRFVAAKLPWVLAQMPGLKKELQRVVLSGDWVAGKLTGKWHLSASDALCNGLLCQSTRQLATTALRQANRKLGGRLNPKWFPDPIASHAVVGRVRASRQATWTSLTQKLKGWHVVAALGDNQATAAGCGATDLQTLVVSLGTSGTINRIVPTSARLRGKAAAFEYWDHRLLLMMLGHCASWYNLFCNNYAAGLSHKTLNNLAKTADLSKIRRVACPPDQVQAHDPFAWPVLDRMAQPEQVASVQVSIAREMLLRVQAMHQEVKRPSADLKRVILTGGLSQAPLVRAVLSCGVQQLLPQATLWLNQRPGPLAVKTDALGALYNALAAATKSTVPEVIEKQSKLKKCRPTMADQTNQINALLTSDKTWSLD